MSDTVIVIQSIAETVTIVQTDAVESVIPVAEVVEKDGGGGVIYAPVGAGLAQVVTTVAPEVILNLSSSPVVVETITAGAQGIQGEQGEQGERGPQGIEASEHKGNFSWGDATPAILAEMAAGETIYAINLVILVPFDGTGAALSIGVTGAPDLLMAASECDPKTAGVYSVAPGYKFTASETIRLFITPGAGATAGNGVVMIDY